MGKKFSLHNLSFQKNRLSLFSMCTAPFAEKAEQNLSLCLSVETDDVAKVHLPAPCCRASEVSVIYPSDHLTY